MDCERCNGRGHVAIVGDDDKECPTCKGTGVQQDTALTGAGDTDYYELWLQASGSLAIIASGLRGSKGDMDDLTAQNMYDMIANEQGMSAQTITTVLVDQTELASLRAQVAALTASAARYKTVYDYVINLDMQHEMLEMLQEDTDDLTNWAELYNAINELRDYEETKS